MKHQKTYRGFYIEEDEMGFKFNESELFGDGTKWEGTIYDVYLKIDDIIIERQAALIECLKQALENSQATLKGVRSALAQFISFETLDGQIKQNEQALKYCES